MKKNDEGFTLIELLIVIVILGILATVVVFAVRGVTDKGQENACKATAKTYEVAIEAWYASGTRADADGDDHPTGDDLEATGLIRDYVDTHVVVVEGSGSAITGASSVTASTATDSTCTAADLA